MGVSELLSKIKHERIVRLNKKTLVNAGRLIKENLYRDLGKKF
jgi:hypothetical protein